MRITTQQFARFLPNAKLDDNQLVTLLTMLGHETERDNNALEVKIFPNRGDCLSLRGLSRELAAFYPQEVGEFTEVPLSPLPQQSAFFELKMAPKAKEYVLCDHLLRIEGYKPTESPREIVEVLRTIGLQPKELLVDLTNFIAFEIGLPMHVFSYENVSGGLILDLSVQDEKFQPLVGSKTYKLPAGLLIQRCNGEAVDLAGTVGGYQSAFKPTDSTALIQAAVFSPNIVRRNSKEVMSTDASYRFQRGVDPYLSSLASSRLIYLLNQYAPQTKVTGYQAYDQTKPPVRIEVSLERISELLGTSISQQNLEDISRLGLVAAGRTVTVPSWRYDLHSEADIAEELGRLIGLNHIKPRQLTKKRSKTKSDYQRELELKKQLCALGWVETVSYSLTEKGDVKLQNPRTVDSSYLRASLLTGLLETLRRNPFMGKAMFFETGNIFLPEERRQIGFVLTGHKQKVVVEIAEKLTNLLGSEVNLSPVNPSQLSEGDVKQPNVFFAEIPLVYEKLPATQEQMPIVLPQVKEISKYPPALRDLTIVVDGQTDETMIEGILSSSPKVLFAELIDEFVSHEVIGPNKKALTFRMIFQDLLRSLTDEEVSKCLDKAVGNLSGKVKFVIR